MSEMEIDQQRGELSIIGDNPLTEEMELLVDNLFESLQQAVYKGAANMKLETLGIDNLTMPTDVCHNNFMDDCKTASKPIQ